jgi:hypothetical protein
VPALFAGMQRASAWGEPARLGFPRRGNGKGEINFLAREGEKRLTLNMNAKDTETLRAAWATISELNDMQAVLTL